MSADINFNVRMEDKWQSHVKCFQEGIHELFKRKEFCDFTFVIENTEGCQIFKAHKYILAARSCEFQRLIFECNKDEEVIKDGSVTSKGLEVLLRFIYLNKLGTEDKMTIIDAYQAAEYYKQEKLLRECAKRFESWTITRDNVWQLYNVGFTIPILKEKCIDFIRNNINNVLSSDSFLQISFRCLNTLFDSEILKAMPAMQLVNRIVEWAANHHTTPVNYSLVREEFMSNDPPLLSKLRIEKLNNEELAQVYTNYEGLITLQEASMFLKYSVSKDESNLPSWCNYT